MRAHRSLLVVGVAALVFAAWEITDHVFLMQVEMVAYHLIGFLAETALAAAAIFWAAHNGERARRERERAERLAIVVAQAMTSSDADISPVASLLKGLDEVHRSIEGMSEVEHKLLGIQHDARKIELVNRRLRQIVAPYVQS